MTTEPDPPVGSAVDVAWLRLGGPESEDTRQAISSPHRRSEKRKATMAANRARTGFRVGDQVTTDCPLSKRFHNIHGRVITTNLGEVGVSFNGKDAVGAWFLPSELSHR